ncbi:hypothetical protein C4579_02275 [Candidatus Microgenomates bacterium]|nr:MAG: hypothetical protein C4579_02275 [Candidatus Microgenomates bacterium]
MAFPTKQRSLFLIAGVLILLVIIVVFVAIKLGGAYRSGLSGIEQPQSAPLNIRKTKKIQKITIQAPDLEGCIEVTPDGVVRVYSVCEETLEQVSRPRDSKYILDLYRRLSYLDLDTYVTPDLSSGIAYTLHIQTDSGTYTIIITYDDEEGTEQIDNLIETIPDPSPTPQASVPGTSPSPSSPPGTSPSPQASGTSPSPSPQASGDNPFICDYAQSEPGKPYRVSNIVCTDEPQAP